MDLGINYSNRAAVFLPEAGIEFGIRELVNASVAAEEQGFAYAGFAHSLTAKPRWAALPLIAAVGARTNRIRLNTAILQPVLYNNPVLLAQELVTLDMLTGGRFVPGFGLGTGRDDLLEQELRSVGVDKSVRGKVFSENLEVIRRLLTEEEVTFHGRFYKLEKVRLGLKPAQRPHPPFWIAAAVFVSKDWEFGSPMWKKERVQLGTVPTADRVAKYGDGWMMDAVSLDSFSTNLKGIRTLAHERYGRSPTDIKAIWGAGLIVDPHTTDAFAEWRWANEQYHQRVVPDDVLRKWAIFGDGPRCVDQLKQWERSGLDTFIAYVGLGGGKFTGVDAPEQVKTIAREVLPAFT